MEPTAVAVHALKYLAKLQPNDSVAIWGCGPVGLLCMAVAKALGARRIIAVDIVPSRLEFAASYAATDVFKPPTTAPGESKIAYSARSAEVMKNELGLIPVSTHFFILKDPILIIGFRNLLECIEEWSLSSKKY